MAKSKKYIQRGFSGGLGHHLFDEDNPGYGIVTNGITRFGSLINGLKEVAEPTGIAAGYYTVKEIVHNGVRIRITTNGTDSKIYRIESAVWALKETVSSAVCTDVISFEDSSNNEILAWCFSTTVAFRYTVDDGANWIQSTFAGTSDNPKYFLSQQNDVSGPRVLWVVKPNQLYFASSLVNGTTISTATEIGDDSDDDDFTSITQNSIGTVYIGKKNYLYAYANGPSVIVHGPVQNNLNEAGGTSDRENFENPQTLSNGTIVWHMEGMDLFGLGPDGEKYPGIAPRHQAIRNGANIPVLDLPINAMIAIGNYLVVALGDGDATTTKSVVSVPGSSNLLINTFVNTSQIYVGVVEGRNIIWHGSELTCTDLLRYLSYDPATGYLYLHSGAAESADLQATRCYFFLSAPDLKLVSSNIQLNTGAAVLESPLLGFEDKDAYDVMVLEHIKAVTSGLASTIPSLAVALRWVGEFNTAAGYTTVETYIDGQRAQTGTGLRGYPFSSNSGRYRLTLLGDSGSNPDRFGQVHSVELTVGLFAAARQSVGVL